MIIVPCLGTATGQVVMGVFLRRTQPKNMNDDTELSLLIRQQQN